jgi:hypothetical protein
MSNRLNLFRIVFKRCQSTKTTSHQQTIMARGLPKKTPIEGVQHIIAVGSGKGICLSFHSSHEVNSLTITFRKKKYIKIC